MKKPFLIALAVAVAPFAVQAETFNIYGWQNHSWEHVDENGRDYDRIQSNAGNIGFKASMDTGMGGGIKVNFQCEQFTYFNHFAGGTGWCNRNSKIGLSHPEFGELMFATWLLPYNEAVAQWVDPFYDAGADSHTSIMGSVGANTIFYNTGDFDMQASNSHHTNRFDGSAEAYDNSAFEGFPEFNYSGLGYDTGFNRRQENIIQFMSPGDWSKWNGFQFRFAWTAGIRDETTAPRGGGQIDPIIRSASLAYTKGPIWVAFTWQEHEDWTAASVGEMNSSDAESWRIAGRYIMNLGADVKAHIAVMYEDLEYEFTKVSSFDGAMSAFGYRNSESYTLGTNTRSDTQDDDVKIEREAWMISGKLGPEDDEGINFRFSYMDADDLDISCSYCTGDWKDTAADAWNVGLFYTIKNGTEFRLTYSEVDNDKNGTYGQGISGTGLGTPGSKIEMFAFGIVHWFD